MQGVVADLRHARRLLSSSALSSTLAILALAVTLACVATCLTLWNDISLRPHPGFASARDLMTLGQTDGAQFTPLSFNLIERIGERATTVEAIAGVMTATQFLERDGEQVRVETELVTRDFFPKLRPKLELGRGFEAQDHRVDAEPVVVVSHDFWSRELGGRRDVVGLTVTVGGPEFVFVGNRGRVNAADSAQSYRIVGVASRRMQGTFSRTTALWLPYEQSAHAMFVAGGDGYVRLAHLRGLASPARGADAAAVRTELNGLFSAPAPELGIRPNHRLDAVGSIVLDINVHREALRHVALFLAGSALLAFVGITNVSLFLLSRAPVRQRELAIRRAFGAPLPRLARQLLSEGALLVAIAVVLGLLLTRWLATLLIRLPFFADAQWRSVSPFDWRVLLMVSGLALLIVLVVSAIPVLGSGRLAIAERRTIAERAGWRERLACTVQLTIAGALTAAALSFLSQMAWLRAADPGVDVDVLVVSGQPDDGPGFGMPLDQRLARREIMRDILSSIPGVAEVSFGSASPGRVLELFAGAHRPESPDDTIDVLVVSADVAYLSVLGIEPLHGRGLDAAAPDEILVNEALAQTLWQRSDAVGELVGWAGGAETNRIAGVVANVAYGHPAAAVKPIVYRLSTALSGLDSIYVKASLSASELRRAIQAKVDEGDLRFRVESVEEIAALRDGLLSADRARSRVAGFSSALVVLLATIGLYGTLSFLVEVGRREYAIRAALGAEPRSLSLLIARRALMLGLPGWVIGSVAAVVVAGQLRETLDLAGVALVPVTLGTAGLTALTILAASIKPAFQTPVMAPAALLREE